MYIVSIKYNREVVMLIGCFRDGLRLIIVLWVRVWDGNERMWVMVGFL